MIYFGRQIAWVSLRESNKALLNLAIYAVFVFTPTEIMAQLNNLAVQMKAATYSWKYYKSSEPALLLLSDGRYDNAQSVPVRF